MTKLIILNSTGDITITWDHSDPIKVAEARAAVAKLKSEGYMFFLVDGSPVDEVAAGAGMLLVRKLTADEIVAEPSEATPEPVAEPESAQPSRRRVRPPKTAPEPDQTVVAIRPVRGG